MDCLDTERKVKIYELILSRYRELIKEKEERSISEIRQMINPYDDFVKSLRDDIIRDIQPYLQEKHFFSAVQKCTDYIKSIYNLKLPVIFYLTFKEIDELKVAPILDQSVLLCSLIRSLGSENAKVHIMNSNKIYVGFDFEFERYLIDPESGTLFRGGDVEAIFKSDKPSYSFSDLHFESFE
ncbi:MAG: hypothetical protein WC501_03890 [Candidatus Micrarchaeia archaeon]|jgi:hypothetical protein